MDSNHLGGILRLVGYTKEADDGGIVRYQHETARAIDLPLEKVPEPLVMAVRRYLSDQDLMSYDTFDVLRHVPNPANKSRG